MSIKTNIAYDDANKSSSNQNEGCITDNKEEEEVERLVSCDRVQQHVNNNVTTGIINSNVVTSSNADCNNNESGHSGDGGLKYELDEKVYVCCNDNQVYLAKVLKSRFHNTRTKKTGNKRKRKLPASSEGNLHHPQVGQQDKIYSPAENSISSCEMEYYVHFIGWNKSHDKWHHQTKITKQSNIHAQQLATLSIQKMKLQQLKRKEKSMTTNVKQGRKNRKRSAPMMPLSSSSSSFVSDQQRHQAGKDINDNGHDDGHKPGTQIAPLSCKSFQEYCTLPLTLKAILVKEKIIITRQGCHVATGYDKLHYKQYDNGSIIDTTTTSATAAKLYKLPINPNISVKGIMKAFVKSKRNPKLSIQEQHMKEYKAFAKDMVHLFNIILPKFLLYNHEEREQLQSLLPSNDDESMSCSSVAEIYGGEFLLRLLVRLPMIISSINQHESTLSSSFGSNNNDSLSSSPSKKCEMGILLMNWRILYQKSQHTIGMLISELIIFLKKNHTRCFKGKFF